MKVLALKQVFLLQKISVLIPKHLILLPKECHCMTPCSVPVLHTPTASLSHTRFHKHTWVISGGRKEHVSLFKGLTVYIWKASSNTSECFEYLEVPTWNKITHEVIICSNRLSSRHKIVKNSLTGKSCATSWVIDLFGGKQVFTRPFSKSLAWG